MLTQFSRSELLLGDKSSSILRAKKVVVFGLGGVGGHCVEALARAGIGTIAVVDNDIISITNINRQLLATHKTIGKLKTDIAEEKVKEINPDAKIIKYNLFYSSATVDKIPLENFDYIVDAIDTVTSKIELVLAAKKANVPIISSMAAGNKLDPAGFEVADIFSTSVCPLCKAMRSELRKKAVEKLKVVYSKEEPIVPSVSTEKKGTRPAPGSVSFVPPVAGLIMAGEVIKGLASGSPLKG